MDLESIFKYSVINRAHSYIHKSQDEPVPCPVCGKMFRNRILLMSHKRIHKQNKDTSGCSRFFAGEVGPQSVNIPTDSSPNKTINIITLQV